MKDLTLNWRQIIPILVTLAAMMAGFFSILVTVEGMEAADPGPFHLWAGQLIMLAMILDGLDGNLARKLKGCSEMGAELDTYVDMTAFGISPALLIYTVSLKGEPVWRVLMTAAVVLSGVVRLARFKVTDPHRGQQGYNGLPITACAGWVALFVFISESEPRRATPWLTQGPVAVVFLLGVLAFIVLQVSNVLYPKPTKHAALFMPGVVLVLLLFIPGLKYGVHAATLMLILGASYVMFGPIYMKHALARKRAADPGDDDGNSTGTPPPT